MRVQGRIKPKRWVRRWMVTAALYPLYIVSNLLDLHHATMLDIDDELFEWNFDDGEGH